MKKILFALVAIALVAVSCKPTGDDPKKDDPTTGCTFTITVSDVTSHEAVVSVIPSLKDVPYYAGLYAAADLEGMTDEEITAENYEYLEEMMAFYAQFGVTMYWADMVMIDDAEGLEAGELDGGTTYTVVAFQMDTIEKTSYPVTKKNFTTEEADPNEAYSFEPTTQTTFTYAPTAITATYDDALGYFTMDITDESNAFVLCTGANYTAEGEKTGTFPVNMDGEAAGSVWGSAGCDGQYIYRTFLAEYDEDDYIDVEKGVYYVTGGSMTVSEEGLTANFTTKFGSTITVNFEGEINWVAKAAQGAPRHNMNRKAPKGPRMLRK